MIVNKKRAPETVPTPPTGYLTLFIRSDTGVPAVKNSDGVVSDLVIPGDASGVTFTPMDNLDWTDSVDPGNVDDALNDLARRMVAVEASGATDASQVTYTPADATDWNGDVDPGEVNEALDQLADRVNTVEAAGAVNSFATIAVSGQSNVVADSSTDTLTFAAAGGLLTITTNAGSDTITFTVAAPDASVVTFTPSNSMNWTDSEDPGDVDDALNDLAARLQAVEELTDGGSAGRHAIWVAAGSITPSASGGCATLATTASASNQPDIQSLDFDTTTQEYAQFSIRMPKSWDEGPITFAPVWSHGSTVTNFGVVWSLQAVAVSDDDGIAVAFGTEQTSTDTGGTTNDIYIGPESSSITVAGNPQAEDMVFFRVSRVTGNASDTLGIDARLHGLTLYINTVAGNDA